MPDGAEEEEESEVEEEEVEEEDWLDTTDKLYWGEIKPLPGYRSLVLAQEWDLEQVLLCQEDWRRQVACRTAGLAGRVPRKDGGRERVARQLYWCSHQHRTLIANEYIVGDFEEAFGRKAEPSRWMAMPDDE